jgi:ABC-type uncharacterized transport system ATPase subunit
MHIQLKSITKRFGSVLANDRVDLELRAGKVMALLGENGAGKSTLMKILYGFYQADSGEIIIDGAAARIGSPHDAIARGIGMVFQQFSLIPALTVRENLALSHPDTPWRIGRAARRFGQGVERLRQMAPEIDPDAQVSALPIGQIQLVELAKVLNLDARLVILDEPSAVLTPAEAQRLWQLVRALVTRDVSVVLITHKLADVDACADRVTVMRQGRIVATQPAAGVSPARLVRQMMGERAVDEPMRVGTPDHARTRVWLRGVSARAEAGAVQDVNLQIAAGEVVGVAGVAGNGQNVLADACAGVLGLASGEVIVDGEALSAPRQRVRGPGPVAYIPEQLLRNAVAPDLSAAVNLFLKRIRSLPWVPDRHAMLREAGALMTRFDVRPCDPAVHADALSGGNLQKLVAARELSHRPALVVACYPTMGLDLAASAMVYQQLFALAREGSAVLWVSEDLDDLLRFAHRIVVMFRGRIAGIVDAPTATRDQLGAWMTGVSEAAA